MDPWLVSLLSFMFVLGGAVGAYLSQKHLSRAEWEREKLKISAEMARKDFEYHGGNETHALPLSSTLAFYHVYFSELDKGSPPNLAISLALVEMKKSLDVCRNSPFSYYEKFDGLVKSDR